MQAIVRNQSSYSNANGETIVEKVAIESKKVAIGGEKVAIENLRRKCYQFGLSPIMVESILEIYNYLEPNQIFGRTEISKYLNFSYANAGKIIVAMKHSNVIEEVKGKGKGKYIFMLDK